MKKSLLALFTVFVLFLGCEKEGIDGKNALMDLIIEPIGENCSSGGYKVITGTDLNNNGLLDGNEIQKTKYVCNGDDGSNGYNSLINVSTEPEGEFCSNGGIQIESGIDLNNNGLLDENEIQNISYTCNGVDGINADSISIIRFPIEVAFIWRDADQYWQSEVKDGFLSDFSLDNYAGFEKAYFIAQFDRSPDETSDSLGLRLFDFTNSVEIPNSDVWSLIPNSEFQADPLKRILKSDDIYNSFINDHIQIGIQYRKQIDLTESRWISIHSAEIRLTK